MNLFDDTPRGDVDPLGYSVCSFRLLNESGRVEVVEVRELLEKWFSRYPEGSKGDLRRMLRTEDERRFLSAFFDLFMHEALRRMGFVLAERAAPDGASSGTGFRIADGKGKEAILECRVAVTGMYKYEEAELRLNSLHDLIADRIPDADYFLRLEMEGFPSRMPPASQFERFIRYRLKSLPPASAPEYLTALAYPVVWVYDVDETFRIKIFPIPKSVEPGVDPSLRAFSMRLGNATITRDSHDIASVIRENLDETHAPSIPYVIAVNCLGRFLKKDDVINAIFGDLVTHVAIRGENPEIVGHSRRTERAIFDTRAARNTSLSGVLVALHVGPFKFRSANLAYFPNPFAARPFDFGSEYAGTCEYGEGCIRSVDGKDLFFLFGNRWSSP